MSAESCLKKKKSLPAISCFKTLKGQNRNLPENCPPTASKASSKTDKKKPSLLKIYVNCNQKKKKSFFILLLSFGKGYLFTIQLHFFSLAWSAHGPVGFWPVEFFSFQELYQCFFLRHWKYPIATEIRRCKDGCYIFGVGRSVCLSLSLSLNCVCIEWTLMMRV